ncbi:dihydroorotase [Vreelandella jeotgali]|uniref:dihydroorotase n=1 Tax=Vreelandella jeotgali TaxID=553386 RepID=UPI00034A16AD|nr:dihydroorotase [Halomonas jeotgali]
MDAITLTRPDDWHLHLRDDAVLEATVAHSAAQMCRAIIMPNLKPPVTTTEQALAYRARILVALPEGSTLEPLMTLYLTDTTPPEEIERARQSGVVKAVKLYPAGATTNSASGVTDLTRCDATIAALAECGMPLLVHGEVTDADVDIFDREAVFLERVLKPLLARHPTLKVVCEHITTAQAADFVMAAGDNVAATITPQHLLLNRNDMLVGGMRPHYYCLPILKRERHREALVAAATSGSRRFFLGTDSAPHARGDKESACGCAGVFSAPAALELYATAFEKAGALDKLEAFTSHNGADFYGMARNTGTVTLERRDWQLPESYAYAGGQRIVPMKAGETLGWKLMT